MQTNQLGIRLLARLDKTSNAWQQEMHNAFQAHMVLKDQYSTMRLYENKWALFLLTARFTLVVHPSAQRRETRNVRVLTQLSCQTAVGGLDRLYSILLMEIVSNLTEALHVLHAGHLVHRDITPDNVVYCRQARVSHRVKLINFGLLAADTTPEGNGNFLFCSPAIKMAMHQAGRNPNP